MTSTIDSFARRREQLTQQLTGGAIIVPAGRDSARNNDVDHEFRQQSSFWYLTGFDEPEAVAVLRPGAEEPYVLFVRPYDPQFEIWVGYRAGVEGAVQKHGADTAFPIETLKEELPKLLEDVETVYYGLGSDSEMDELISGLTRRRRGAAQRGGKSIVTLQDPKHAIDRMRLIKGEDEIAHLQRAIDVTQEGFNAAMGTTGAGRYEYQVQAEMESAFRRLGSPRNGYPSIVASGTNSCTLHYVTNRAALQDGDLLLIDAGAEVDYYTADITRTWPVSGKYSPEQRAVYEIVLDAQRQGFEECRPGALFDDVHLAALRVLVQGLVDLKVLEGSVDGLIEDRAYRPYYMHGTSHWLGLDVHDAGQYRVGDQSVALQPGMVFTVEPGLYFGPLATESPEALLGIGIRIEDDVLITEDGHRNLSAAIPSSPGEVEGLVGSLLG